jgi:hypothetical protein
LGHPNLAYTGMLGLLDCRQQLRNIVATHRKANSFVNCHACHLFLQKIACNVLTQNRVLLL